MQWFQRIIFLSISLWFLEHFTIFFHLGKNKIYLKVLLSMQWLINQYFWYKSGPFRLKIRKTIPKMKSYFVFTVLLYFLESSATSYGAENKLVGVVVVSILIFFFISAWFAFLIVFFTLTLSRISTSVWLFQYQG